jgi:His/Glu/Gln/Arg/opine family amino acid ABC transporter permease subunit
MDFTAVFAAWPVLLSGTLMTLGLTGAVLLVATPAGFLFALARNSRHVWLQRTMAVASWLVRGIPPLLLLLIVFFVPGQFGVNMPSFLSALVGMGLYMAFYFAEIFRGGLASVGRGQFQAAESLGLSPLRTFGRIILPQMLPAVLPSYISHASSLLKNTALASAVAVRELTGVAKSLFAVTYRPLETLIVVAAIYALISALLFLVQFALERRWARRMHRA